MIASRLARGGGLDDVVVLTCLPTSGLLRRTWRNFSERRAVLQPRGDGETRRDGGALSPGYDRARVARALAGDRGELDVLVALLAPIVQVRVARALARRRDGRGRDLKQEAEDLRQEVFLALFADDGRWLRAWDETRGMSLVN